MRSCGSCPRNYHHMYLLKNKKKIITVHRIVHYGQSQALLRTILTVLLSNFRGSGREVRQNYIRGRVLVDRTFYVCSSNVCCDQRRSQEFATGDKRGGLGYGSPPAGSRGRAPVEV